MFAQFVAFAVGGYLLGSIPVGVLLGKLLRGIDVRDYGSGSMGTTNTLRTLGKGPAVAALILDALKGVLPVLLARYVSDDARLQVVGALAAVIGHDFPVYIGFRGGRGVATSLGATAAMMPLLGPLMPLVGGLILIPTRYVSLMSLLGTIVTAIIILALAGTNRVPDAYAVYAVIAASLIVFQHRSNISRLLAGTEPKIGQGGGRRPKPESMRGRP
jgi:glycerol-3-phosphate acyltransferase PlsY